MVLGAAALGLLLLVAGAAYFLVGSHHAPPAFALSTPAVQPSNSLAGKWKVATGSEVGYRVREQFINQPSQTEAVARTNRVSGGMQVRLSGATYLASSIDFVADLNALTSEDRYATFQAYQRDFFVRRVYLQTDLYPDAEFKADSAVIAVNLTPGPVKLDVQGKLTVHGETRSITTELTAQVNGNEIEMAGSVSVDMRDYNVSVPDISFTKAQPAVVIEYHLVLVRG